MSYLNNEMLIQRIISILYIISLFACTNNSTESVHAPKQIEPRDSLTFIHIHKDVAYTQAYKIEHLTGDTDTYRYTSGKERFSILFDRKSNKWIGAFSSDITTLYVEQTKHYTINHSDFEVYKLIRDKGVTDGEMSYFFTKSIGLLISKSNTWRSASFLKDNYNTDMDIKIKSLIFEITSDAEFFDNKIPEPGVKFIPPRLERD